METEYKANLKNSGEAGCTPPDGGNYQENEVLQPLSVRGWFEIPLQSRFSVESACKQAPIPSPLCQKPRRQLLALERGLLDISEGVRNLYRSLQSGKVQHRKNIIGEAVTSTKSNTPHYAFLPSDSSVIGIYSYHVINPINGMHGSEHDHNINGGKTLELRRLARPSTDELGYFIINTNLTELSVNEQMINPNTIFGPLPDFSIIEVGRIPIFWWRTPDALDYAPIRKSQRTRKRKSHASVPTGGPRGEEPLLKKLKTMSDAILQSSEAAAALPGPRASSARAHADLSGAITESACIAAAGPAPGKNKGNVDNGDVSNAKVNAEESIPSERDVEHAISSRNSAKRANRTTPTNWAVAFREGEARCKRFPADPLLSSHTPHVLEDLGNLSDNDVVLAIASVWRGLRDQGIHFAFADSVTFQVCKTQMMVNLTCVGSPQNLIIPLYLGKEDEAVEEEDNVEPEPAINSNTFQEAEREKHRRSIEAANKLEGPTPSQPPRLPDANSVPQESKRVNWKGAIGHHVLVIASRQQETGHVHMYFLDSLVTHRSKGEIRRAARNIVRNSDWLGGTWPTFGRELWHDVSQQHPAYNACGMHTVLNAWAYMLNIKLRPGISMNPLDHDEYFYWVARRIINLAMQGYMDGATIRAFMQHQGFSRRQTLAEYLQTEAAASELQRRRDRARTRVMNEEILDDYLKHLRESPPEAGGSSKPEQAGQLQGKSGVSVPASVTN
ncbi:MAG: hypothetical protein Q9163_002187 [Psora crenata]